jgi:mannose-6-phosphate isomerase
MAGDPALLRPWRLLPNRVRRFYRGGLLLDRFRGTSEPADSDRPEDWLGSVTRTWTRAGAPVTDQGLGFAEIDGARHRIADLVAADPGAIAGADLIAAAGVPTTGVLVKLLDAGIRLPVHAHPTRAFARTQFGSFFGKAEAWLVLATRDVPGEPPPSIRLGFPRDVGRDELRRWIEKEDGDSLLGAMHERPTTAGDTWFVPAGAPHAIGAGIFLVEVQEPTDYSIVAETRGFPVDPNDAHLGLGWDVAIDGFERGGLAAADLEVLHGRIDEAPGDGWTTLLPQSSRPFFRAARGGVAERLGPPEGSGFVIGVVTAGTGTVTAGPGTITLRTGDAFAVPAAVRADLELRSEDGLEVIACLPPEPGDLDGATDR